MSILPEVDYLILASRLVPDLDGGFTISVVRRARDIAASTDGPAPLLLTIDPAETAVHDAHRAEWVERGMLGDGVELRNLFDDARADQAWLRAGAHSLPVPESAFERRAIANAEGSTVIELPVITGDPAWHLTEEPVVIWAEGAPVGWLAGFGGLYRAWLNHVAAERKASHGLPVVVLCEARQIGELLVAGAEPTVDAGIHLLHTTHACHLSPPYADASAVDPTWQRWLDVADRFDAVLWLTEAQAADVRAREPQIHSVVVPHPAPPVDDSGREVIPGRIVMVNTLSPRKRIDHALRALARVRRSVAHAELHVYGGGAERDRLAGIAAELGVTDAVVWHGHVADPAEAWRHGEVFVLTSTNEGQGLVVLEALAHGLPVVSYDMPYGPAEMLADGGGVVVADGDIDALADALIHLLADDERRAAMATSALTVAGERTVESSMAALARAVAPLV